MARRRLNIITNLAVGATTTTVRSTGLAGSTFTPVKVSGSGISVPGASSSNSYTLTLGSAIDNSTLDIEVGIRSDLGGYSGKKVTLRGAARAPAAPTITATAGDGQITISVTNGTGYGLTVTGHRIWQGAAADSLTGGPIIDAASTQTISAANGTARYVAVSAISSAGESVISNVASATPVASATAPAQVGTVTAIPGNTQVVLSWTAPSNGGSAITDYVIQYRPSVGGEWTTFSDGTSTATTATVTGLTNGTTYDFHVAAVNAIGTGTSSASVSATPLSPGGDIPLAELTVSGTTATLADTPISGWTYTLYREGGVSLGALNSGNSYSLSIASVNAKYVYCVATKSGQPNVTGPNFVAQSQIILRETSFASASDRDLGTTAYDGLTAAATGQHSISSGRLVANTKTFSSGEIWLSMPLTGATGKLQNPKWKMLWNQGDAGNEDYRSYEINRGGTWSVKILYKQGFAVIYLLNNGSVDSSVSTPVWSSPTAGEDAELRPVKIGSTWYYQLYTSGVVRTSGNGLALTPTAATDMLTNAASARFGLHPYMAGASGRNPPFPSTTYFNVYSAASNFFVATHATTPPTRAADGTVVFTSLKYQGTVANIEVALVDRSTRKLISAFTSHATNGDGTATITKSFTKDVTGYANVMAIFRDASDHSKWDEFNVGAFYFAEIYETIPGVNFASPSSYEDGNYYMNRAYQSRFAYYDSGTWSEIPTSDIDADGYPMGTLISGTKRLVQLFCEGGATPPNQGTWQLWDMTGATYTVFTSSNLTTTGPQSGGVLPLLLGSASTTQFSISYSVLPTNGLKNVKLCHTDDVGKSQIVSDILIENYGYHPTLRPDRPRAVRMLKNHNGEGLATRSAGGAYVPQGAKCNTGAGIAQQCKEMGWELLYLCFQIDATTSEITSVLTGIASYTSWTGRVIVSKGNEIMWNISGYNAPGAWLISRAMAQGYLAALPAGTTHTVEPMTSAVAGTRTYIEYNGTIKATVPSGTKIVVFIANDLSNPGGSPSSKWLLLEAKATINVGAPQINPDTYTVGTTANNWQCLATTTEIFFAADRCRTVETAELYVPGVEIFGVDRFGTVVDQKIGQATSSIISLIDVTDLSGNPVWDKITEVAVNPYLYQREVYGSGSAWLALYASNQAGFVSGAVSSQHDLIAGRISDIKGHQSGFASYFWQKYGAAGPKIITYETGTHLTIEGTGFTASTMQAAWQALFDSSGWQTNTRDHASGRYGTGIYADMQFMMYAAPKKNNGTGQYEIFGLQSAPKATADPALAGFRQAIADWN